MTTATNKPSLFTRHSRQWRQFRYVYPVISRRSRGLSIGVNLNPDKACNFDCVYCSVDRVAPPAVLKVDLAQLRRELDEMLELASSGRIFHMPPFDHTPPALRRLNDIAFSGEGEPTSYPHFQDACELVVDAVEQHHLRGVKIIVISNATLLYRPGVKAALAFLDQHVWELWAKLDAGTQRYYERVARSRVPLSRVLTNILNAARLRPIVIQSMFMKLGESAPDDAEIAAYVERLKELTQAGAQIKLVQIYTVSRRTAEVNVTPLADCALDWIAEKVHRAGLPAEAFYGAT